MPDRPAGAAERDGPIERMANNIPPIPGVETRQLLKAGWTVIGGNPAAKVAHFPKTFRTPAPKFPRHRIRTTWGFRDEAWSLLEDSVNIDDLESVYGEVPEGTIASITLFALPEGEEEVQADSDVEPYSVPRAKKDEASLRAEAVSAEHQLTHRPKNPYCPVCQRAKMYAPQARKTGGSSTIYSKAFGDHITVDHIITADAKDYGFQEETVAHVVKDVYSNLDTSIPRRLSLASNVTKTCCTSLVSMMRSRSSTLITHWSLTMLLDNCVLDTTLLVSMLTKTKQSSSARFEQSSKAQGPTWCNRDYPIGIGLWHLNIMLYALTSP